MNRFHIQFHKKSLASKCLTNVRVFFLILFNVLPGAKFFVLMSSILTSFKSRSEYKHPPTRSGIRQTKKKVVLNTQINVLRKHLSKSRWWKCM